MLSDEHDGLEEAYADVNARLRAKREQFEQEIHPLYERRDELERLLAKREAMKPSLPMIITAELLEKLDAALRCEATTSDGLIGTPPIECFLSRGHQGHHRTKENGEWAWEF